MEIRKNSANLSDQKRQLRRRALAERDALDADFRKLCDNRILQRTLSNSFYKNSNSILCYASYKSEVATFELIKSALHDGKKVYIPKVDGLDMDFYRISSLEQLVAGYKGIPEPGNAVINDASKFSIHNISNSNILMIMPGAAFDINKNRIGYGKGFYDRYILKTDTNHYITKIAYAYDIQVVDYIEAEETDQKIDYILTEKRFF